ncbi:oligosaccharide flippase family protein, partial [Chloroflexota bacterium]
IYFQKELEFNKQFFYQVTGTLADFAVAVSVALVFKSIWALVFGFLAGNIIRLFVSYLIHPYRPRLSFDSGKVKELFGFGKWILGSSILIFLITQGDGIFVGKLLGVTLLGFYQMAYRFSNAPATEIAHVISQVTFPAYSKLQDNLPGLRKAYLKTLQFTAFISVPLTGGIIILAPEFTSIFLGEKWMPIVPVMQVLALWGAIRSMGSTAIIFRSIGKPRIITILQVARLILMAAIIYPLSIKWGILGTSLAVLLSILPIEPFTIYLIIKITQCRARVFGKQVILPVLGTLVMCGALLALKYLLLDNVGVFSFFALVAIGVITYAGMTVLLDRLLGYNMTANIKESLGLLYKKVAK